MLSPLFNEEERAVHRYADAMTGTLVWVPDDIFEARKRSLYRLTDLGGNSSHCLGALPRAVEPCPRSGSRGFGRASLPGAGGGATASDCLRRGVREKSTGEQEEFRCHKKRES